MEKHEKHYERVQKRLNKLQHCICRCTCGGGLVGLNESLTPANFRKRFFMECLECHWCGKSRATIRGAIRAWNREMRDHAKWYADHIGDVEEAEEG
jgi:hypothetical protein